MQIEFTVPGQPVPKARPRLGRGGRVFTPKRTHDYEYRVRAAARLAVNAAEGWPVDEATRYGIDVVLYMGDRRARDGDNMLKAIQDGCQPIAFLDDKQCTEGSYKLRYDKANPRAEVLIRVCQNEFT